MLIGITGMPGAGKSTFSKMLSQHWGVWLNMDLLGHQALERDDVKDALVSSFGVDILTDKNKIDRSILGKMVFDDKRQVELNAICHPSIKSELVAKVKSPLATGQYYIQDAALLFEAGFDDLCDYKIMIQASFEERLKRVSETRKWSEKELLNRDASQNEVLKVQLSDYIVHGECHLSSLENQACQLDIAFRYSLATGIRISHFEIFQGKHS